VGLVFLGCFGAFLIGLRCVGLVGLHGLSWNLKLWLRKRIIKYV